MQGAFHESVLALIGKTPMVRLHRLVPPESARILMKLEFLNPTSSLKDRIALSMIEAAERRGDLRPGDTVVEPTSGNTGCGLALVCAIKGYRMIAVLPEAMSRERVEMLRAFGAEVVLTRCVGGPRGSFTKEDIERAVDTARELARRPGHYMPDQFSNPDNVRAHYETTAAEIWEQCAGRLDAFVMGIGTSGTCMGVGRRLKELDPRIAVVAVEPETSAVISGRAPGAHTLQGIGEGFIPELFDRSRIDGVRVVGDAEAKRGACLLARREGILTGYSGGANLAAALEVARELGSGKIVVTIAPDSGLKYLSTDLFHRLRDTCTPECAAEGRCEETPFTPLSVPAG